MNLTRVVRMTGAAIFLGLAGFFIYEYHSATEVAQTLATDPAITFNDGEPYLIPEDTSDLHLHDTYYIVISPSYLMITLLVILVTVAITCLAIPSKIISLFRRKS